LLFFPSCRPSSKLQAGIAALEAQRSVSAMRWSMPRSPAFAPGSPSWQAPASPGGQALRQVSILFLDLVGSTTLSQHLDPEEIHAVVDGALARFSAIVEAIAARVLQYAGDNLLAAFGADEVREDDPERAVHCGLALLAEGQAVGRRCRQLMPRRPRACVSASTPAASCSAAASTAKAASWPRRQHRGADGADRAARGLAHQQRHPRPGARTGSRSSPRTDGVKGVDAPIRSWLVQRAVSSARAPRRAASRAWRRA
jgi:hypothetical protein